MKSKYSVIILIVFLTTTFSQCDKDSFGERFKNKSFVECYINGDFVRDVKKTAIKYLNNNIYSFIGSDAHRDKGRNTDIKNVIKILEYNQRKSFINNGKAMLKNEEIEFRGIPIKEKKFLGIF